MCFFARDALVSMRDVASCHVAGTVRLNSSVGFIQTFVIYIYIQCTYDRDTQKNMLEELIVASKSVFHIRNWREVAEIVTDYLYDPLKDVAVLYLVFGSNFVFCVIQISSLFCIRGQNWCLKP